MIQGLTKAYDSRCNGVTFVIMVCYRIMFCCVAPCPETLLLALIRQKCVGLTTLQNKTGSNQHWHRQLRQPTRLRCAGARHRTG